MNNLKQILTPESIVNNSNNNDTVIIKILELFEGCYLWRWAYIYDILELLKKVNGLLLRDFPKVCDIFKREFLISHDSS